MSVPAKFRLILLLRHLEFLPAPCEMYTPPEAVTTVSVPRYAKLKYGKLVLSYGCDEVQCPCDFVFAVESAPLHALSQPTCYVRRSTDGPASTQPTA